ncbi:MAG TPA: Rid family hydrolase [Xanthomonadaceae bacterium]|jgi:2-iminobutanoate/2-iminopropanoate deaminase|nr:Rid family hydrolase [Xanthomonadaceae bacterium]
MTQTSRLLALVSTALLLQGCASTGPPMKAACYHRDAADEIDIGYCEAVRSGNTLYISGTVGRGEMGAAVKTVYGRLDATLKANGLTFANVVKENVYTTDLDAFIADKDLRKPFYGTTFPAATWVQVQRLYVPALVLEVELTAVYPN